MVGLAATLAVAQVDPAAAITGVLNIVRDFVDIGVPQPDANALLLQGLQGVSKQLSAFAEETAAQFRTVDARLEALTRQVACWPTSSAASSPRPGRSSPGSGTRCRTCRDPSTGSTRRSSGCSPTVRATTCGRS